MTHNSEEYDDTDHSCQAFVSGVLCGNPVHANRWSLGYRLCLSCGDQAARDDRASWCVVQPYGKGPYMLVTVPSARQTLLDTNQKAPRS